MVARPLVVPVATRLADRRGWLKGPLVAATWATAASMLLLQASHGFVPILAANALASLAFALILPFADAFALRGLTARGRAYGPVRLWGSVTFIVANVGGGLLLERLGAGNIVWALTAAMLATALAASLLRPLGGTSAVAAPATAGASLWGSRTFVAVVAIGSVVQSSHAVLYGFASLQWAAKGLDGLQIGALWGIGVVAEIADRVAVMQHGRVVEQGAAREILTRPDHPSTKALLAAVPGTAAPEPRALSPDTVLEVRYVGNHGTRLWRNINLNETNVIENGFAGEFRTAMGNLRSPASPIPTPSTSATPEWPGSAMSPCCALPWARPATPTSPRRSLAGRRGRSPTPSPPTPHVWGGSPPPAIQPICSV